MRNILKTSILFLGSAVIFSSCGGGGGSNPLGSLTGGNSIKLKSLSVQKVNGADENSVINPGEEFYIRWDISASKDYGIAFFARPDSEPVTLENKNVEYFYNTNCIGNLFSCSKGVKCKYTKEEKNYETKYFIQCVSYSNIPGYEGWPEYPNYGKKLINPYNTNYIVADAYIWIYESDGDMYRKHSTKSIPITFSP